MINPLAQGLNETLKGSVVDALMSDMGKRLYFPNGIISQGGEAAKDAKFANGTIGMAVANGTPIELDSYKKSMPNFNPRETVAYAKTAGNPDLRKMWKEKIIEKNPSLKDKNFSLPILVPGLTAVLSYVCDLFIDEDRENNIYPSKLHLCCNECRGNEQIVPLFFLPNVNELFVYRENGRIGISNKVKSPLRQIELSNTIDELVLEHERLNIIRQVWCLIAKSHLYCIDDVKTAISDDTLRSNILADCGVPARIEKRVRQPIYWSLLCDYYWFYRYFYNS